MPATEIREGGGRTAVFIHASPGTPRDLQQLRAAAPDDWRLVSVELLDHGAGELPDATLADLEDDARDVIRAEVARGQPVSVIGCSLGAYLAARIADDLPQHSSRLVLVGGFKTLSAAMVDGREQLAAGVDSGQIDDVGLRELFVQTYFAEPPEPGLREPVEDLVRLFPGKKLSRTLRRVHAVVAPALHVAPFSTRAEVFHDPRDQAVPFELGKELVELGENAQLRTVDARGTHCLWLTAADEIATAIYGEG